MIRMLGLPLNNHIVGVFGIIKYIHRTQYPVRRHMDVSLVKNISFQIQSQRQHIHKIDLSETEKQAPILNG